MAIPRHIFNGDGPLCGYIDGDNNQVSGVTDTIDLCPSCVNVGYRAAMRALGLPKK